jgi:hypothetical protein
LRAFGNFLVEIIHQHAHGGFLLPALAGNLGSARGADGSVGCGGNFGFNRHGLMVVLLAGEIQMRGRWPDVVSGKSTRQGQVLTQETRGRAARDHTKT